MALVTSGCMRSADSQASVPQIAVHRNSSDLPNIDAPDAPQPAQNAATYRHVYEMKRRDVAELLPTSDHHSRHPQTLKKKKNIVVITNTRQRGQRGQNGGIYRTQAVPRFYIHSRLQAPDIKH
ncbi:hypothetical protein SNOG_07564 [Parastagonospora nodorum SN15]|uniref:Uncharacterized protein n=1 Tax=Phaeosphaeria nodorum (strain SN15 / ATCC MYA-4574 / FGSC 10173) TaxID=321614 RepID=Q0UL00_PHANO|nr:hypothetical protein SNOG_07564 [Parastagonospora nodorum SN15]EAT85030.1 hypothetical protein SNOG_07564 [Parastagonospora nodorum SN15]